METVDMTALVQLASTYLKESMLILIPVLIFIGWVIKNSLLIKDELIPPILVVLGIIGSVSLEGFSTHSVIQGFLVALASVGSNQLKRQLIKIKTNAEDTEDEIDVYVEKEEK